MAVSFPVRPAAPAELAAIARMDGLSFGHTYAPVDLDDAFELVPVERFLVATDPARSDEVVGATAHYEFEVTVPGGAAVAVPGVSWVSVAVTHRRRGILRELMNRQLSGYVAEHRPFAVLTASEGGIYRRFGYGAATLDREVSVDRSHARLAEPADASDVLIGTAEQAAAVLPALHRRLCAQTPGAVSRDDVWWKHFFADRESHRAGMSERHYLLHPDGYVGFRVRRVGDDRFVSIRDDAIVTAEARAAIWSVLLSFDLYTAIETSRLSLDDPLPLLLTDPRRVRTTAVQDGLWVRLLDIGAALSARTYGVEVDTVLEVRDPLTGGGRFRLQGGPDGATCVRTDATPELSLDVATLGSAYLGGHRLDQLARAGRVEAATPRGLARLDLAFLADRAPSHGTNF